MEHLSFSEKLKILNFFAVGSSTFFLFTAGKEIACIIVYSAVTYCSMAYSISPLINMNKGFYLILKLIEIASWRLFIAAS